MVQDDFSVVRGVMFGLLVALPIWSILIFLAYVFFYQQ